MRASLRTFLFTLLAGASVAGCGTSRDASPAPRSEAVAPAAGAPGGVARGSGGPVAAADLGRAEAREGEVAAAAGTAAGSAGAPAYQPAPAGVRAGEWDDNANYRDYLKWIGERARGVALLDVADREYLVVRDRDGKPVPSCTVSIEAGAARTSLVTLASGRALWFPRAYGATGPATATARCGGGSATAKLAGQLDGVTELVLATARELPARRPVDVAFVLDTTGSMGEEIDAVKQTIRTVASELADDQVDVRIGLVEYKDRTDRQVTTAYPFSSDLAAFGRSVDGLTAGGGGDLPEDMQRGVADALERLSWRADAVVRMVVVIADAPPHLDYQDEPSFADSARLAARRGIKLFTVSASGMDDTGQVVMRQMAQFTGASNMFVLRGGAGPQSVGGGDPQSSCGGTHEQYASGKLDRLILGKVEQELASVDADPMKIAGLGQDESSRPCSERISIAR